MIGYLVTTALVAVLTAAALVWPRARRTRPTSTGFWLSFLVNEVPFLAVAWLVQATVFAAVDDDLTTPLGALALAIAVVTAGGLVVIVHRALRARPVLDAALDLGLGGDRADRGDVVRPARWSIGRWLRIVCWPFPWWPHRGVRRRRNLAYGPRGRDHRLDVYVPRGRPPSGPVLVHWHGGGFRSGSKSREARALVHRLAAQGWVCVMAAYRLRRDAVFPDVLVDAKRAIAWTKAHAVELGADPDDLFVAGSSAGGHLAATAALTPNDPTFQPGFAADDTSTRGAICLYPYTGSIRTTGPPSSPLDYVARPAPPFFVAHGDRDSLVIVEDTRAFVARLRAASSSPVVSAELPGGQHVFDMFHSIRFEAVVDAIETFLDTVRRHGVAARSGRRATHGDPYDHPA